MGQPIHSLPRVILLAVCLTLTPLLQAEEQSPAAPPAADPPTAEDPHAHRYEFRDKHDPNGIGKFYMDREIAHVMGAAGIPWLERPERETEESLSLLIDSLDLKPGEHAADIGAGSGVLTFRMADRVGPKGLVWAVDIQPEMLEAIQDRMLEKKVANVRPHLCTLKETKLPPESLDLALFVDVYHELEYPYEVLLDLSKRMKTGGRIVLVEYRKEDPEVPIKLVHKMHAAQVRKELAPPELKLQWKKTLDVLPRQHIIIFEKQP